MLLLLGTHDYLDARLALNCPNKSIQTSLIRAHNTHAQPVDNKHGD